jgi:hypothetical protein
MSLIILPGLVYAGKTGSSKARIIFISKEPDNAKTYISKLKKGDFAGLKYELQRYSSGSANEIDVNTEKGSLKGYVERITVIGEKNNKRQDKIAQDDLIGNYEITDEEALLDVKVKKLKKIEEQESKKDETGNYKKYSEEKYRKNQNQLSEYYKISKGKRIRNGQSFTKPAGGVTLIITYKVNDGRNINTYVNVVEGYLKPNSTYNLRYHGSNSQRRYYLEYVSSNR